MKAAKYRYVPRQFYFFMKIKGMIGNVKGRAEYKIMITFMKLSKRRM